MESGSYSQAKKLLLLKWDIYKNSQFLKKRLEETVKEIVIMSFDMLI
jgi:hypothetical protein